MAKYLSTRRSVYNRGKPPIWFLDALVTWARRTPLAFFAPNKRRDVYWSVASVLGPWEGLEHRRAVMCEILRVLAGFESSWTMDVGRDHTNPNVDSPLNEEAGLFQVSPDSMDLDRSLWIFIDERLKSTDPQAFLKAMKTDAQLAIEYAAMVLRVTTRHHGPVRDGKINAHLRRAAVEEFERLLL